MTKLCELEKYLPKDLGEIIVDLIDLDGLIEMKDHILNEPLEEITCRPRPNKTEEEEREDFVKRLENENICALGIYLSDSRKLIGRISIFDFNSRNRCVEIGYFLQKGFRGKGYSKLAINYLMEKLFEKVELNKIKVQTCELNEASLGLLSSLGFQKDGVLREHHELNGKLYDDYIFSILRSEYLEG